MNMSFSDKVTTLPPVTSASLTSNSNAGGISKHIIDIPVYTYYRCPFGHIIKVPAYISLMSLCADPIDSPQCFPNEQILLIPC